MRAPHTEDVTNSSMVRLGTFIYPWHKKKSDLIQKTKRIVKKNGKRRKIGRKTLSYSQILSEANFTTVIEEYPQDRDLKYFE